MDALIIIAGVVWVLYMFAKEATLKPAPKGTDPVKVNSDRCSGKFSDKEINRRIQAGYYVKNKEN